MTRKPLLIVVGLIAALGLTLGVATAAVAAGTYTITATAGDNGSINPIGVADVPSGGSVVYTMQPATGYQVATITVDGAPLPATAVAGSPIASQGWYTFLNVTGNHTISVTFKPNLPGYVTVTPYAGEHGEIWMAKQTVPATTTIPGSIVACSIIPDAGYHVATLVVDGTPVTPATSYIFYNVQANHTISATFEKDVVPPHDVTPPVTISDADASYVGSAVIHLTATDASSAVAAIYYQVDGGAVVTVTAPTAAVTVTGTGSHTLKFWAADTAGNVESGKTATFAITAVDATPPVTVSDAVASYAGTAVIHLTATDAGSGVAATYYTLDGGSAVTVTSPAAVTVTGIGSHTLVFWSADNAGNVEAHNTATFAITAPAKIATNITKLPGGSKYTVVRHHGVAYFNYSATCLEAGGAPCANEPIKLLRSSDGINWKTAASTTTDASGHVSVRCAFRGAGTAYWKWFFPGDADCLASSSSRTAITVK